MLEFKTGDIFKSEAKVLVNPVNSDGISGAGLAKEFKTRFPANFENYKAVCNGKQLAGGMILLSKPENGKRILYACTKHHWRDKSKYAYIIEILHDTRSRILCDEITSIAIPKLGCGLGGLKWEVVKELIIEYLGDPELERLYTQIKECKIEIYE